MQTVTQEENNECRNHEKIHVRKENHIAFSQEPRLEDSKVRNQRSKWPIEKYTNKEDHRIKRLNICGSKIKSEEKMVVPLKTTDKKIKTWIGTSDENRSWET